MSRIQQLDPVVINKIAAGEVIERPASVIKELMENSVDALSTRIRVDVEGGGAELIRIADDGHGIHPDDFELAISSHATSKIRSDEDLFRVHSMGFRGEALASVASVSRCRIRSRIDENPTGREIEVTGGHITSDNPCGCPVGTTIEIRDLFGNTPVRRKFLKTAGTEFGHIAEQFTRIALANPRLHLTLTHNGKTIHELPATNNLIDRLRIFHGDSLTDQLIRIDSEQDTHRLWGYVAHPSQTKGSRKGQYLFLNGRHIQDRALGHALSEAYRGLVMIGRHPIAFLFLEMPASDVDVNVHPSKSEVRFRDSQRSYRQLLSALRSAFLKQDLDGKMQLKGDSDAEQETATAELKQRQSELQKDLVDWATQELSSWKPTENIAAMPPDVGFDDQSVPHSNDGLSSVPDLSSVPAWSSETDGVPVRSEEYIAREIRSDREPGPSPSSTPRPHDDRTGTHVPGASRVLQVSDCYLVMETDEGLTVIDQHALHERILYEQFRSRVLGGGVESQKLLVPEPIELSAREASLLLDHVELLQELGFGIEDFGNGTILLNAYPVLLRKANLAQLVRDLADRLDQPGKKPDRRELIDSLLHMMACKAAIKAGQRLTPEEMDSLLALRHLCEDAHHCPHGRPTALVLSRDDLDRQFGRLGAH